MLLDFVNVMKDEGMLGSGWQIIGSDSCSSLPRFLRAGGSESVRNGRWNDTNQGCLDSLLA